MSSATPQSTAPATAPAPRPRREIVVVSHSNLFYWWPVWAVGFIMFLITYFGGDRMATIPPGSILETQAKDIAITKANEKEPVTYHNRDVLVAPEKTNLKKTELHISSSKNLGVIFCLWLLLVIGITNVPLRGLWSVIVIVLIIATVIILALLPGNFLETLLEYLFILDVRINAAGYLMISLALFILWLLVFLLFDQQIYMVFTPGQLRVKLEIGDAETVYDTTGLMLQKQRSDLFRHWILGLGSGDLICHVARAAGEHGQDIPMANVLFVGRKVHEIEKLLRERQVVAGPAS